jgi:hypothetical protein
MRRRLLRPRHAYDCEEKGGGVKIDASQENYPGSLSGQFGVVTGAGGAGRFWKVAIVFILLLTGISFYLQSVDSSRSHPVAIYDEVAVLDLARDFKDRGSPVQVINDYFQGRVTEDNRHPLYPMLLSGFMKYEPGDFARAKSLNLAVGLAFIFFGFLLSYLLWGGAVGCLTALFLGVSSVMIYLSSQATPDLLFAFFYFASLAVLMKFSGRYPGWLAYGVTCGLAYLTKGNAYLLLLPALVWGLWNRKRAFLTQPHFYMMLLGFAFISSFLIFRNLLVFHAPFHNMNSKVFWLDGWPEYFVLSSGPEWGRVGLFWYLSQHSFSQILVRLFHGIQSTGTMLVFSMGTGSGGCLMASGVVMLGLALFGLALKWRDGHRQQVMVVGCMGGLFFLLFSWYDQAVGGDVRFMFPVAASLVPFSSIGVISLYGLIRARLAKAPDPRIVIVVIALLAGIRTIVIERNAFALNPLHLAQFPVEWQETSRWIREHLPGEKFLLNNRSFFSQWDCCRNRMIAYPFEVPGEVRNIRRVRSNHFSRVAALLPRQSKTQPLSCLFSDVPVTGLHGLTA